MKEVNWMMDTLTSAVEELYALYHRDIVRFFAEHLADRDSAWDLCHEVFVRLLITLASGTQLQHPHRWLTRVARNLSIPPSYGGRASFCKRSTNDGGLRICFLPTKKFLSISMP